MNKCRGCGSILQTRDSEALGYIDAKLLDKPNILCKRCFNIKNYSTNISKQYSDEQFIKVLKQISSDNLIIMVVDIFDLSSTLLPEIIEIFKQHDILLFVNKVDMLPSYVNLAKLLSNIVAMYLDLGLNIIDGCLISAKFNFNIDYAKSLIDAHYHNRDMYIVGVSNVGKSQFIQTLLNYIAVANSDVTVSHFPATTIETLQFDYEDNKIYDTPGVINRKQIIHYIDERDIKYIYPKQLKQFIYQLSSGMTLFISGYARIDVIEANKVSFTLFCSEFLNLHRRKTIGSKEFYDLHLDDILVHKYLDDDLVWHDLVLEQDQEVVINGLGFFKVNDFVKIKLLVHRNVGVSIRKKLI